MSGGSFRMPGFESVVVGSGVHGVILDQQGSIKVDIAAGVEHVAA